MSAATDRGTQERSEIFPLSIKLSLSRDLTSCFEIHFKRLVISPIEANRYCQYQMDSNSPAEYRYSSRDLTIRSQIKMKDRKVYPLPR